MAAEADRLPARADRGTTSALAFLRRPQRSSARPPAPPAAPPSWVAPRSIQQKCVHYSKNVLTPYSQSGNLIRIPAHRGAPSGGKPEAEPGVASRGCGLHPQAREARDPARQALSTWLRGARWTHSPEEMPETEARPPAKNRHGGAPRGVRVSLARKRKTRATPRKRGGRASQARQVGAFSALRSPSIRGRSENGNDPDA